MAERKPLSLNERNNRLLQDLSRSRPAKPPPPTDEKVQKVKLEGRRRLCKLSSSETTAENSQTFDSPPEKEIDGEERIRDILDDLTSRLECLSMQKKTTAGSDHDAEPQEFGSANSSLSPSSFSLDTDAEEEIKSKRCVIKGKANRALVSGGREDQCVVPGSSCEPSRGKDRNSGAFDILGDDFVRSVVGGEDGEPATLCGSGHTMSHSKDEVKRGYAKGKAVEALIEEEDEEDCVVLGSTVRSPRMEGYNGTVEVLDDDFEESLIDDEDGDPITFGGSGRCRDATYFLPGKIAKMLYPHQRDGLSWLWSLHCSDAGGILGDDMGLGKTMQISSFLAGLFHSHLIKRALIVAPKTLLSHWTKELSVVGLAKKIKDYFGVCTRTRQYELLDALQEGGVLLTTYDIVRNNSKSLRANHYLLGDTSEDEVIWDYVILDEGHLIKNPSTQRAKSLLEIPSSHRVIISGTPIQNNLKELWALFNFCCPRVLGDKQEFKERYEHTILRGSEKNASAREKGRGSAVAKELRERIRPYFLRRLKSEVFLESDETQCVKLSKKNELIVWLRLSQCQRQLYEAFLKSDLVHSSVDGSPLAAITILKKICDHPLLLTKRAAEGVLEGIDTMLNRNELTMVEEMALKLANVTSSEDARPVDNSVSCKICFIMPLLENLVREGHSVLIFSQTRKMLNLIQETILSRGYAFSRIDGTTKISDREKIVNDFQTGNGGSIFMLTSQVGGLGLTLTKADRVIVVDPAWNPSTDNQSVDRAYRIGQKKDVVVYRLMTCGTIEEKIYKMQIFKGGLFKTATEHKEQTRYFSQKDIRELFSLPEQGFDVSLTQKQLFEEHDCHHTMDEALKNHILFLENQGIAGVSQHSLLYSKTATVLVKEDENREVHRNGNVFVRSSASGSSTDIDVNAAAYAFKPKDVKASTNLVRASTNKLKGKQEEIEEKIKRLSRLLENKGLVSYLPDKGEKIRKRIFELNLELSRSVNLTLNQSSDSEEVDVINLDDLTEELQKISV